MPQGSRKVPFSAKQKKIQLQQKRERKHGGHGGNVTRQEPSKKELDAEQQAPLSLGEVIRINAQVDVGQRSSRVFRYCLQFKKESPEELQRRKQQARKPYVVLPEKALEVTPEEFFLPGSALDIPKRPPWNRSMTREALEAREAHYFRSSKLEADGPPFFCFSLEQKFNKLHLFLQLWRVLEMSEVILLVADIRHPVVHFPPALHKHVTEDLGKRLILVLNKIDLVPDKLTAAWIQFFRERFPGLVVLPFASYAGMTAKGKKGESNFRKEIRRNRYLLFGGKKKASNGPSVCPLFPVDLSSWREKIDAESAEEVAADEDEEESDPLANAPTELVAPDTSFYGEEGFKDGRLTLGFVGHPNVGKSSLLNALMGRKVVSVSRTPGHTKHFQTIFLTDNVRLCDCPGLVFPSLQPKALQVLTGCFPVAQLREPYSAIEFLAKRLPVPSILKLEPPESDSVGPAGDTYPWSAFELCEAWALQRGYLTAKAGRPDSYRAANSLLRMALDGRTLCLSFRPPGYSLHQGDTANSSLVAQLARIRGETPAHDDAEEDNEPSSSEDDEGDEDDDYGALQTNKFAALEDSS
ncbi:GTP-binding protein mmr1, putative [Ixodes scapularis]|uniref:Guanine nucleotide-binding protein-like 1 n=1 Tax=Ixodes scapularis TaxID=6945 RepID=B7P6L0_IXOSC|nr:GTP-binding protein mmr1, putative [Ixodes scapularis]|eukprot:XP_002409005.1 GTP-binding protein mmr1, putative [Ixodes scapularis]